MLLNNVADSYFSHSPLVTYSLNINYELCCYGNSQLPGIIFVNTSDLQDPSKKINIITQNLIHIYGFKINLYNEIELFLGTYNRISFRSVMFNRKDINSLVLADGF